MKMFVQLPDVPRKVRAEFNRAISYRKLYVLVVDGRIQAQKGENGRWQIENKFIKQIADTFGVAIQN
jgi:hypothetical protein